jgi:hypothetical protein
MPYKSNLCIVLGKNEHKVLKIIGKGTKNLVQIRQEVDIPILKKYYSVLLRLIIGLDHKKLVFLISCDYDFLNKYRWEYNFKEKAVNAHKLEFEITERGRMLLNVFK